MLKVTEIIVQECFPSDENLLLVFGVNKDRTLTIFEAGADANNGKFEVTVGTKEHQIVVGLDELIEALQLAKRRLAINWPLYLESKESDE